MGIEYKHLLPKLMAKGVNRPRLIGIACYQNKAVGIRAHGIDECCDSKVYVRTLLFKLHDMRHSRVGFFADLAFLADMGKPCLLFAVKSLDDFHSAKCNESLEIYLLPFLGCNVMWICADACSEELYGANFVFFLEHGRNKCTWIKPFIIWRFFQQAVIEIIAIYVNKCLFHVCQRMQGASTSRLKPPRRIGRASRVEYNPLMGSVRIVPNSAARRKGVVCRRMSKGSLMTGFETPPPTAPNVEKGAEMNGRNLWGHTLAPLMPECEAKAWDGLVQDMNGEAAR